MGRNANVYKKMGVRIRDRIFHISPLQNHEVKIEECFFLQLGREIPVTCSPSVLALDGEREIDVRGGDAFAVRLAQDGPMVMDVHRTMQAVMKKRVLAPGMTDTCFRIDREHAFS